jgi:hypothetical protein
MLTIVLLLLLMWSVVDAASQQLKQLQQQVEEEKRSRKRTEKQVHKILIQIEEEPNAVNLADLAGWNIVIGTDAISSEFYAAEELQNYLGLGQRSPTANGQSYKQTGLTHLYRFQRGYDGSPVGFGIDEFGSEDLRIIIREGNIAIAGGRPRGMLYGVYTFLEDYFGVSLLSPDHTHVPAVSERRIVSPVDRFYHPL